MEAIKQQFSELQTAWSDAYEKMRANPSAWQPHLPGIFAEQIDEVVSTIGSWLGKVDAPDGFKPSFHLAKGLVAISLPQLVSAAKSLQSGEYKFLPSFVGGLNQILSALHSMVVYSAKHDAKHISADLAAQLAEALSLLGTAQAELKRKADALESSTSLAKETEKRAEVIDDLQKKILVLSEETKKTFEQLQTDTQTKITKSLADLEATATTQLATLQKETTENTTEIDQKLTKLTTDTEKRAETLLEQLQEQTKETVGEIGKFHETAKASKGTIETDANECTELKKQINNLLEENTALNATLGGQSKTLTQLQEASEAQSKLIRKLLPEAASAGLASAFETRASNLENTKMFWAGTFMFCILGLVGTSIYIATLLEGKGKESSDIWVELIHRLPFVAPWIWLGWFSAIQYGNTIRVQEDYAFKAATSKAFEGYRDHMEHLANVKLDEANNAMKLLAVSTIQVLSREPLRIYQKTDKDVSPASSILSLFGRKEETDKEKK